jgi:hypothetical protein
MWSWPLLEKANCATTQELPNILWDLKVHYRVDKSPPLVPILSQINPIHETSSYFSLSSTLLVSSCLRLGLPSGLFHSDFPTDILYAFITLLPCSCYILCPSHPPWLHHSNYGSRIVQVMKMPCHHGMARPQVADGGDGLQFWRAAANILKKQ